MPDLIYLLNTLVSKDGEILIDNIMDDVAPETEQERSLYHTIDFDVSGFRSDVGCRMLRHKEDKVSQSFAKIGI